MMPPHTNRNADTAADADNRLNAPKPLRLAILGFAVAMLILTAIALACGPAAPGVQDGGDNGTAATATPEADATNDSTATPSPTPCGPQEFQTNPECFLALMPTLSDFGKKYQQYGMAYEMEKYEKAQAEARASGAGGTPAPSPTPYTREIRIFVDKDARLKELTDLLNQHEVTDIYCYDTTDTHSAYCTAVVPVSLLKTLADTGWVITMLPIAPASLSSAPQVAPGQTIRDPHGVANWHPHYNGQRDPDDNGSLISVKPGTARCYNAPTLPRSNQPPGGGRQTGQEMTTL